MKKWPIITAVIPFIVMNIQSLEAIASGEYKEFRVGIGYSFVGESLVVDKPITNRSDPARAPIHKPTVLPSECMRKPCITKLTSMDVTKENFFRLVDTYNTMNIFVEVECGNAKKRVKSFFEVTKDGKEWIILNNPSEKLHNIFFKDWLERTIGEKDKYKVKATEKGNYEIIAHDKKQFTMTIAKDKIAALFEMEDKEKFEDLKLILKKANLEYVDYSSKIPNSVVVFLYAIDNEVFFPGLQSSFKNALDITIAISSIDIEKGLYGMGQRYNYDWRDKIAKKLSDDYIR